MAAIDIIDDKDVLGDNDVEVWLDETCIGAGATRDLAIDDAIDELEARLVDLKAMRAKRAAEPPAPLKLRRSPLVQ